MPFSTTNEENIKTMKSMAQSAIINLVTKTRETSYSQMVDSKTTNQNVGPTSATSTEDADKYWPVAMAIAIGVPSIIVIGVTISVINRKRLAFFVRKKRLLRKSPVMP
jgi:hypothetical protein